MTDKGGRQNLKAKFLEVLFMASALVDACRLHVGIHVKHHLSQLLDARVRHLFMINMRQIRDTTDAQQNDCKHNTEEKTEEFLISHSTDNGSFRTKISTSNRLHRYRRPNSDQPKIHES